LTKGFSDRQVSGPGQAGETLPTGGEEGPEALGDGEHDLTMWNRLDNLLCDELREE
jgi:hypothetical protein